MRKVIDVFFKDRLVASYPVVLEALERPSDEEFVSAVKRQMRVGIYSRIEIKQARFVVRGAQPGVSGRSD